MIAHPRKLNCENLEDWPSAKIRPHENFQLYDMRISSMIQLMNLISLP